MPDRLTDAELDRLERIAGAATPGPWEVSANVSHYGAMAVCNKQGTLASISGGYRSVVAANAYHVATFDREKCLSLIRELRELRQRERKWVEAIHPFAEWWKKETGKQMNFDVCWREDADGLPVAVFDALADLITPEPTP